VSADGIGQTGWDGRDMPGGGTAQDGARAGALERRYLRLLRCYPPSHREEMLGVLLATAGPRQGMPGARQTVNLVACGLAIRARRALRWLADDLGQDALAVVSLIAPVVTLIVVALGFVATVRETVALHQGPSAAVPYWQPWLVSFLGGPAAVMICWLAVVLLALTGRRRAAAAIASILLALGLLILLVEVMEWSGAWSGGFPLFLTTAGSAAPVVLASLAACSLAFSAGPGRGLAIVGRRRACLMIAGLSAGFGWPEIAFLLKPSVSFAAPAFSLLVALAFAVAVVVPDPRSDVGWRVAVLVATGILLDLAFTLTGDLTAIVVLLLGSLLFALLMWPLAIASWRERVRQASRAG
jgi:hypothetical protein